MAHLVITIGCEYGAKGNMIGRKVAKDLGMHLFLLVSLQCLLHLPEDSFLYGFLMQVTSHAVLLTVW